MLIVLSLMSLGDQTSCIKKRKSVMDNSKVNYFHLVCFIRLDPEIYLEVKDNTEMEELN